MTECQLDELWSFVRTKDHHLAAARQWCETMAMPWVWVAFAPAWRLVVAFVVGQRTHAQANLLLDRVQVTDQRVPFFTSDQWPGYPTALLHAYGEWCQPERQGKRGRYPAPRCLPPPSLLYAQVVKRREKGQVVEVTRRGSGEARTSFRRDWRHPPPVRRSTRALWSGITWPGASTTDGWPARRPRFPRNCRGWKSSCGCHWLTTISACLTSACVRNCPHRNRPEATDPPRKWRPVTPPAMAVGMTDHVWTTAEFCWAFGCCRLHICCAAAQ